jgi:hypothetical protein
MAEQGLRERVSAAIAVRHPDLTIIEEGGDGYAAQWRNLKFIVSAADALDGKLWLHASVSRLDRTLPTYQNLKDLKRLCIGDHRTALQVFPPKDKHINYGAELFGVEVLHLWCCLDSDVTPDFSEGGDTI